MRIVNQCFDISWRLCFFFFQQFHSGVQAHHNELVLIQMSSDELTGLEKRDSDQSEGEQAKLSQGLYFS